MNGNNGTGSVDELNALGRSLTRWRHEYGAPTPIPSEIWQRAARLAAEMGVCYVAQALRLNPSHLKRKMVGLQPDRETARAPSAATFIELLPAVASGISECALEVESSRGARMRVVMKNLTAVALASILREFAG